MQDRLLFCWECKPGIQGPHIRTTALRSIVLVNRMEKDGSKDGLCNSLSHISQAVQLV